jgi:transcriptional regulator with XRE-family HTH domain
LLNPVSPTVRRRRLALELRRLREVAGLTCEEVGDKLECSASKVSRVETGRVSVSPRDVRDMLEIYGVTPGDQDALVQLARESRQKGWWNAYSDSIRPQLATYLGMESAACDLRAYQVHRLPGLLQTEEYARATFAAYPMATADTVERQVAMMTERQRQAAAGPPRLRAVLDEATLRRQVGGPEVMRAQLERLIELCEQPDILLQVLPFRTGAYLPMDMPFIILGFPDEADPDIVAVRYPTGVLWIEDPAEVDQYSGFFRYLQAAALPYGKSAEFLASVLKDF